MSLVVSLPCAVVAAVAYGASTAVEHSAAQRPSGSLLTLVRNPRWLLGMAGDSLGLIFQVIALATGPVVLVQPILVLALPVSLPIAWLLGAPRPGRAQYLACGWIIVGLGVFFALLGNPGGARVLPAGGAVVTAAIVIAVGTAAVLMARGRASAVKAAVYGGVAGAWFGFVAVLMDASAEAWSADGISAFRRAEGLLPLVILVLLGAASIALTQVAFAAGALGASFPANLTADPVVAVILGALLLHEDVPVSPLRLLAYLLCLSAVLWGAVRLAAPE